MGTIHKLKPEVINFIVEEKKNKPALSCRKLTLLILEKFNIKISKSSINIIIKEAGLSAPIGRTPKKKKRHIAMPALPILLEGKAEPEIKLIEEPGLNVKSGAEAARVEAEVEAARQAEEEKLKSEAEALRIEAEVVKKAEEEKLRLEAEAARIMEEEARAAAEAERIKAEETKAKEEQAKADEEAKRVEEARLKAEAEAEVLRKAEEEKLRLEAEEEKRRLEVEAAKIEAEAVKKAEEERLKAESEEAKAKEEQAKADEEAKKAEEEAAKKAEQEKWAKLAEEEKRVKEEKEISIKSGELSLQKEETLSAAASLKITRFPQIESSGILLLKAADYLIGGSRLIAEAIKKRADKERPDLSAAIDNFIYLSLIEDKIEKPDLDKLLIYLAELERLKALNLDIARAITSTLQEVRCVKVVLSAGSSMYLDGQMYSVWSSPHIPHDFSSPMQNIEQCINKYLNQDSPLVLFNAPGYDVPSQDFLDFLSAMDAKNSMLSSLVFYNHKLEELSVLPAAGAKKRFVIFGVWPWQFVSARRVKSIGEFRSFKIQEQDKELFIADIEMELTYPKSGKQIVLSGCALKANLNEKSKIAILSNLPLGAKKSEELAGIYLGHWPNIEETFQDYSRKIELFTYTANAQSLSLKESLNIEFERILSIKDLLKNYLMVLDAYLRWHFLPAGYENIEFLTVRERFYGLNAALKKINESGYLANFILPSGYSFARDLSYASCRVNERKVLLSDGLKLYLKPG
jgi:hypothetical protein